MNTDPVRNLMCHPERRRGSARRSRRACPEPAEGTCILCTGSDFCLGRKCRSLDFSLRSSLDDNRFVSGDLSHLSYNLSESPLNIAVR